MVLDALSGISDLIHELAKHFDRDPETNEVLWFSAPPLNVAHSPTPKYSLAYLHFLATKRKQERPGSMDVDNTTNKRQRLRAPPTMTETLEALLADTPQTE